MGKVPFLKMHGLGNDFVVLDARDGAIAAGRAAARALADRHTGIGCDQLIVLEPPRHPAARLLMRIRNPDGSEAEACGNAARCVAWLLSRETGAGRVRIETVAGLLEAEILADGRIAVDMGPARTGWREIPLARAADTDRLDLAQGPLSAPVCTNIGNPHATFFVDDAEAVDLAALGPPSNITRCSRSAPISAWPRSAIGARSGCGCGSGAPGSPGPAAAAPAPRWSPPIAGVWPSGARWSSSTAAASTYVGARMGTWS